MRRRLLVSQAAKAQRQESPKDPDRQMPFPLGGSRRTGRVQGSPVEVHCAWRRVHWSAACAARVTDLKGCDDALRSVPKRYTTRAALGQRACGESAPSMSWDGRRGRDIMRTAGVRRCGSWAGARSALRVISPHRASGRCAGSWADSGHASPKRHTRRAGHTPTRGTPEQVTSPPTHRRAGRSSESECAGVAYEARVADADVEPGERASVFGVVSRRPPRACEPGRVAHQLVCLPGPALGAARTPRGGTGWHSEVGRRARREMWIGTAARWHVLESGRVWLDDRRGPSCLSYDGGRARWHTA